MYGLDPSEVVLDGAALVVGAVPGSTLYLVDMAIVTLGQSSAHLPSARGRCTTARENEAGELLLPQ
jgi:hypothetical protein